MTTQNSSINNPSPRCPKCAAKVNVSRQDDFDYFCPNCCASLDSAEIIYMEGLDSMPQFAIDPIIPKYEGPQTLEQAQQETEEK